ncbi:MAG: MFS transporter [Desulfobacteraceae bacterium]|nr:MAG: MFS transporter [Desulfobacteraceae bacterium]
MNFQKIKPDDSRGFKFLFRALAHRNYRLFFGGQSISLIGTWMQQIAVSWLAYRLTDSAVWLVVVGFSTRIPALVFAPFGGVLADRWDRHRTLVVTQALSMIQALILAVLVLANWITIWELIVLSLALGTINALDVPVRQSYIVDMVETKEDLSNAIAMNSTMVNGARLIGPSIAGLLIAAVGEGMCFLLNGLSFIAVLAALLAMRVKPKEKKTGGQRIWVEMKEGFRYAFGSLPIRALILLLAMISLMGMPFMILMPIFADKILHGGPRTLGFLMGATGIGALSGALFLASRKNAVGLMRVVALASGIFGIGLILLSLSRELYFALFFMAVIGFGMIVEMAATNTLLQTIADEDKRGRIMSIYTMAFMGMIPFGSLLAGSLADIIGTPRTILLSGICCVLGSLVFALKLPAIRKISRPIYRTKGLIAEDTFGPAL